jgi:high-affinity iron transporter
MFRRNVTLRALPFLAAAVIIILVALVLAMSGGSGASRSSAATSSGTLASAPQFGPTPVAHYQESSPHVASRLSVFGVQGTVRDQPAAPAAEVPPVSAAAFGTPVAAYRAYSGRRLRLMQGEIAKLESALAADDRSAAQTAWLGAYGYYLNLGAVYLEGPISDLNDAIDGTPGGLPGGVSSPPRFSGLHRIERGLWTGAPLASLQPWARKLSRDVAALQKMLPGVEIDPLDYATRAHEILEDAVRDQLSGTDAPWSGAGVLGTSAGVVATTEVMKTLAPVLQNRESVMSTVTADLTGLRSTLASLARAHGGSLPTTGQLTQMQSEQLSGSIGQALEGLAQVPGALETTTTPVIPEIPAKDARIDP